jgi:hypothetical protein
MEMVSVTPWPLYSFSYWIWGCVGPESVWIHLSLSAIKTRFLIHHLALKKTFRSEQFQCPGEEQAYTYIFGFSRRAALSGPVAETSYCFTHVGRWVEIQNQVILNAGLTGHVRTLQNWLADSACWGRRAEESICIWERGRTGNWSSS